MPSTTTPQRELTELDRAMIDFAGATFRYRGSQEEAILDLFGIRPTRYWQRVNALIDQPAALAHAPVLVNRLRRQRDQRRRDRSITARSTASPS